MVLNLLNPIGPGLFLGAWDRGVGGVGVGVGRGGGVESVRGPYLQNDGINWNKNGWTSKGSQIN